MKAAAMVFGMIEWVLTLGVSLVLLIFGADRISQWLASNYAYGAASVEVWPTIVGCGALITIFFLIHPQTRWYAAAALTVLLVVASLSSLSFGEPQSMLVPVLGLACASIVQLSHRVGNRPVTLDAPPFIRTSAAGTSGCPAKQS